MKLLFLLLLAPLTLLGQSIKTQYLKSPIKEVKLFLTSGEMLHEQEIVLEKGRNKIIFSGISAYADPQSIRFTSDGDYRLLSLSTEMDFIAAEQFNPRIGYLNDSLEKMKDKRQENEDLTGAYNAELGILNANKDIGGENQNLTVAQIKETAEFYRKRTLEINNALSKIRKDNGRLDVLIENIRFQLVELNYNENQRSNQVIVLLDIDKNMKIQSNLKYLVSDCGWAAIYDLTALDLKGPIELKYKAQVYNNTGNEWNDVDLILSTGDPRLSASHPEMTPWIINYYSTGEYSKQKYAPKTVMVDYRAQAEININSANDRVYDNYVVQNGNMERNQLLNGQFASNSFEWDAMKKTKNSGNPQVAMRQIEISELTTEFVIKNKFTCPSDAKPYLVDVKQVELKASFSHISIPKLDNAAFLMANIVGWQELELIPGPTNVYFGGAYVGMSEINTRNVSDTLSLSFGRDNKVLVMRKLKNELSTKKVIGSSKKDVYQFEIVIRNNRDVPIEIEVFDQIPISRNAEITVTSDQISGAEYNMENGELKWKHTISPSNLVTMDLGYSVKYPKNYTIETLRFRTISCPSF